MITPGIFCQTREERYSHSKLVSGFGAFFAFSTISNNDEQHSPSFSVETTCPLHLTECSCEESFQRICPNECSAYPAEVDGARGRAPFARLSHADLAAARSQMQTVNKKKFANTKMDFEKT